LSCQQKRKQSTDCLLLAKVLGCTLTLGSNGVLEDRGGSSGTGPVQRGRPRPIYQRRKQLCNCGYLRGMSCSKAGALVRKEAGKTKEDPRPADVILEQRRCFSTVALIRPSKSSRSELLFAMETRSLRGKRNSEEIRARGPGVL
jgi:hypothetical protein